MKTIELYISTTKWDLLKRSIVRVEYCAVPCLLLAWLWSIYRDDRFFGGWWLFWCVVVIPVVGLALDLWRLMQTQDGGMRDVEPGAAPNGSPEASVKISNAPGGPPSMS